MNIDTMNLAQVVERLAAIDTEVRASQDTAQVEALTTEKGDLLTRKSELESLEARKQTALDLTGGGGKVTETRGGKPADPEEKYDTQEYRKAFMKHVLRGTPIPAEYRTDYSSTTADVPAVIPTIIVNRIVETMESIGMILPLVTRTQYAAGVSIPTSAVKPTATWVNEGAGSERQKKTTGTSITFGKFKLRCEIGWTMETGTMALSVFESTFTRQVSEAMVKAIEAKIISTDAGVANPKGILAETPAAGQAITASKLTYDKLVAAEAALPQAYEANAVWCMTKKTFMSFIGMMDAEGQPIARTNYGINGKPERILLGRPVVLCGDYLYSFSSATAGQIFAFIFNFQDYALNTVYDMGIQRRQDWDTEDTQIKAVMSVDGKVIDINSLVTLAKA